MGATGGVSEPILYSVTASRLLPLLLFLGCLGVGLLLGFLFAQWRRRQPEAAPRRRWLLGVGLLPLTCLGLWAAVQLASPPVLLKATERGLTSYMTGANPSHGVRLQMARHADGEGLFVPWRAMESLTLDTVGCYDGRAVRRCEVLAIGLHPGFGELRTGGVVVAPGGWRSTLDLPVPVSPGGEALLVQLRTLQQRYAGR
jgi:hypothetical protein